MKELTIGKLPDNILVIDNKMVSRHHAKIVMDRGGRYELIDLGSKNGTYVNGRKVRGSQTVKPGDRIVFATSNIPYGWERIFDQIPDDEPELIVNAQTGSSGVDPSILSSVLYDFGKDVDAMFAKQSELFKQIITDYIDNRIPTRSQPTVKQFSEEIFDLLIERYDFWGKQLSMLLNTLEHKSAAFQEEYASDMQKLDTTYQYYLRNSKGEADLTANLGKVDTRKDEMKQQYEALRKAVLPMINALIEDYSAKNPPLFTKRMELAPADSALWKELPSPGDDVQKTFYLGDDVSRHIILQEPIELRKRVYGQSLYGGNLLFKYTKKHRQACFDTVNTLICRMLAATPSGNMQVVMVDLKEMEGTCGTLNRLNKGVFKVVSRPEDFSNMLNEALSHTENIIQNILQGEITNIAEYNQTETEKVAFTLWVLKDLPMGRGNDFSEKLARIMRNGPRAGVSVLVLLDEEIANQSEESKITFRGLQNALNSAPIETCYFASGSLECKPSDTHKITHSESFSNNIISTIVKKVNQGLEVKTETILEFSEYMLPEKDWWKGESAKRIDLPFGISKEMKTTALQITQESGQNSAVVIGLSGSGKSVFLHTIIASAITHYSPKELQLYLLDFSGVEFNKYAKYNLPHARVIAPEAEREFGLSILREVYEEANRRMALCSENGVTDIVTLKQHNPDLVVPRLLVIIDEFQKIFEVETDSISKEANAKIDAIIREYRKFGINLIFATQKLPAKSIVDYDLIANRVVFQSEPNDFNSLIRWPYSIPHPRFKTFFCIYNNESGTEMANYQAQEFVVTKKTGECLLKNVAAFANRHSDMTDSHKALVFRSKELPEYTHRILAKNHSVPHATPREVGIYFGENIAIAPCHVYAALTKDNGNNILIIGGDQDIAKGIGYYAMLSIIDNYTEKSCIIRMMNFMTDDDPMQDMSKTHLFIETTNRCDFQEVRNHDDVIDCLEYIKEEVVDARKNDSSIPQTHYYITIYQFQRGRVFDGTGTHGDIESKCASLLAYILRNGPMVGVFTIMQVDNLASLNRLGTTALSSFNHRIALQMSDKDSDRIIGTVAAHILEDPKRPETKYRALYQNSIVGQNFTTKFKPYSLTLNQKTTQNNKLL